MREDQILPHLAALAILLVGPGGRTLRAGDQDALSVTIGKDH